MKLIAIRVLPNSLDSIIKVLEVDKLYYFVSGYEIIDNLIVENKDELLPLNFFSKIDIEINISAIVGKNGSGKSTIVELLFRIVNNLAWKYNLSHKIRPHQLSVIKELNAELYFKTDSFYKIIINGENITLFKSIRNKFTKELEIDKAFINQFFYSIAVNYSHYSYNVNDFKFEGKWINGLFHKNDGYQIPLVITPMRIDGDIDINNENHLVKSRLLLMLDNGLDLNVIKENLNASHILLTLKESKRVNFKGFINSSEDENSLLLELGKAFNTKRLFNKDAQIEYKIVFDYIICKVQNICYKYDDYKKYVDQYKIIKKDCFLDLVKDIFEDNSHVTLKLRQAIYMVQFEHILLKWTNLSFKELNVIINNQLALARNQKRIISRVELLPPSIFDIEIFVTETIASEAKIVVNPKIKNKTKDIIETTKPYSFSHLSSGEKQMAYSFSSLLYHLYNLDSITNTPKRNAYKHVNFILEEIELYFHPEMQRKYISKLIQSVEIIRLTRIKSINFCFITHSPFILSDIPMSNVLFLDKGQPYICSAIENTFGANIHMLFKNNFFLSGALMGEFAKNKIIDLFEKVTVKSISEIEEKELLNTINLIGEPLLRDQLFKKYNEMHPQSIAEKINKLELEIAMLKYDL